MKNFVQILLIFTLALGFAACDPDDDDYDKDYDPNRLEVTYANLAGHWQLVSYNDHILGENTYLYITFERRDHTFHMYDNLESMYGQKRTGTYLLEDDEDTETTTLSGFYDNGVGAWDNEYTVTYLSNDQLRLTTIATPQETHIYKRVESLPETLNK